MSAASLQIWAPAPPPLVGVEVFTCERRVDASTGKKLSGDGSCYGKKYDLRCIVGPHNVDAGSMESRPQELSLSVFNPLVSDQLPACSSQ